MRHLFDQHIETYRRLSGLCAIPCWLVLVGKASTRWSETGRRSAALLGGRNLSANSCHDQAEFLKFTQRAAAPAS